MTALVVKRCWRNGSTGKVLAEYRDIDDHLTAELCKLSLHFANFVERRLVSEAVDGVTQGPKKATAR